MAGDVKAPDTELRFFGDASFERDIGEYEEAAGMLVFPKGGCRGVEQPL